MSDQRPELRCGNPNCPTRPLIDEPPGLSPEQRQPCPVCGFRSRASTYVVGDTVNTTATATFTVVAAGASSVETDTLTADVTSPDRPALRLAFPDSLVTYALRVNYTDLGEPPDPPCLIELLTPDGDFLASGAGLTPGDALSVMFEQMLPPSSSERVDPGDLDRVVDDEL